jgi:hypothetical protein
LIQALYEGEISINYLLKRAGKPPRPEPEWSSPAFSWQSFTGLSFAQTNLAMVVLPDHLTVAGCAGSLQSPYHDIMVRLLQKQDLSTEVKPWIGTESSDFYTRAASVTERPLSRFKFPEAA